MHGLLKDLRYAWRSLRRAPGFTLAAVVALGLGTGSATAIYSLLDGVVLRPLPFADPQRLVSLWESNATKGLPQEQLSPVNFLDYRALTSVFSDAAAWWDPDINFSDDRTGEPVRLTGVETSRNLFSVLGVTPRMGPGFTRDSAIWHGDREIVISDRLWRSRFLGDPAIIGRSVRVNGFPHTVVGVMAAGFTFPGQTDVWQGLVWNLNFHSRGAHFMEAVARLKPGVTADQADREMLGLTTRLGTENVATNGGWTVRIAPLDREIAGIFRPALFALFGAAGLLLLIACLNVANLLLARATARQREVAIRAAIGASRGRLVRQLLTESLVLATLGAVLGFAVAVVSVKGLLAWTPVDIPRVDNVQVDLTMLLFATVLAVVTALGFGLAPALLISRAQLQDALREGTKSASAGGRSLSMRNTLVVAEVALAVMLLSGAGLLIRTVGKLVAEDSGIRTSQVLTANVQLPEAAYADWPRVATFFEALLKDVRSHPQVADVGAASFLPLEPAYRIPFGIVGRPVVAAEQPMAQFHTAEAGYFGALGVPLTRGRLYGDRDLATTPPVVVVNETLARQHWPSEDPIGRKITIRVTNIGPLGRRITTTAEHEVIGVVGDIKNASLRNATEPAVYFPQTQFPFRKMHLVVRGNGDPGALLSVIRDAVRRLDPTLPVADVRTMDRVLGTSVDPPRLVMLIMAIFAGLALALAAVGIYGILSYAVTARSRELAIRVALGAEPRSVLGMVVREGLVLVAAGCLIGALGAYVGGRSLAGLLYEVAPADPLTMASVLGAVVVVGLVACLIPGRRASLTDPIGILRGD
jgi:putative ABC transport system permease protein